jgi:hypothetical protein
VKTAIRAGVTIGCVSPYCLSPDSFPIKLIFNHDADRNLADADVINLEALTPAMAETKFRHALALYPNDLQMIRRFIATNVVGEVICREPQHALLGRLNPPSRKTEGIQRGSVFAG